MKTCKTCDKKIKRRTQCSACRQRKWRKNNPFKYHWKNQRNTARQRGYEYTITLEQFKELWQQHPEKWDQKKDPDILSPYDLHRIDNSKGYHIDNVEIVDKDTHQQIHAEQREQALVTETEAPF